MHDWGNRDPEIKLPKTGWAKSESVDEGRWSYLNPQPVVIPAEFGYEKGVWFTIDGGIRGLLIERQEGPRVYMLTKPATAEYARATSHDRMPLFVKGDGAYSNPIRTGSFKYRPSFDSTK